MARLDRVTKEDVIAVAAQLFEERGYHRTRADDIAQALNIAKPTLYSRTQGKGELLEAIMQRVISSLERDADEAEVEDTPAIETLRRLYQHHVSEAVRYRSYFHVLFMDERELPEKSRRRIRAWGNRYTKRFQSLIEQAMEDGDVSTDLDPRMVAYTILGAANWVCVWYRDGDYTPDEVAERSWALFVQGLLGGKSPARSSRRPSKR